MSDREEMLDDAMENAPPERMREAVSSIVASKSYAEAAERLGIHVGTLWRWRKHPDFAALLLEQRNHAADEINTIVVGVAVKGVRRLEGIIDDTMATNTELTGAIRLALEYAGKATTEDMLREELRELRDRVDGDAVGVE